MGAQNTDEDAPDFDPQADESQIPHEVSLAPFFIARHELTQRQWSCLWHWSSEGRTPSRAIVGKKNETDEMVTWSHPVENVDWTTSDLLLRRNGLVLPTEAQWEYACRAGTTTPWWSGDDVAALSSVANVGDAQLAKFIDKMTPAPFDDGAALTARVGSHRANAFGLFDVHGNVCEWCLDEYGYYDTPTRPGDGYRLVPSDDHKRIMRGGSWLATTTYARSAYRTSSPPADRQGTVGLRAARSLTQ